MVELTLETLNSALDAALAPLRAEVANVKGEVTVIRTQVSGLPIMSNSIHELRQDMRMVRAAINDMAKTDITSGEVEALHQDLERLLRRQEELEARIGTIEARER